MREGYNGRDRKQPTKRGNGNGMVPFGGSYEMGFTKGASTMPSRGLGKPLEGILFISK
jgi:hypothetical protein